MRHVPTTCDACGARLDDAPVVGEETRQVFDLPELKVSVTVHLAQRRRCSCGRTTAAAFPVEAAAPAVFGPVIRAVASYLMVHQHIPVPVSTGWLAGLLAEADDALAGFSADLRARLVASEVLGNDETGARIAGQRYWFHDATTERLTWITCHKARGAVSMAAAGVLPGFGGVSIHDRYAQYWYFHERGGTTLDQPNLRRRFTRLCKIAGIGKLSPYELRDSAATIPLARGVPLLVVSELLGHSSFRETKDVYGHLVAENSRRAAQATGKALYGH